MNVGDSGARDGVAGDMMGDLNGGADDIAGCDTKGSTQFIRAQVPMAGDVKLFK